MLVELIPSLIKLKEMVAYYKTWNKKKKKHESFYTIDEVKLKRGYNVEATTKINNFLPIFSSNHDTYLYMYTNQYFSSYFKASIKRMSIIILSLSCIFGQFQWNETQRQLDRRSRRHIVANESLSSAALALGYLQVRVTFFSNTLTITESVSPEIFTFPNYIKLNTD